MQWISGDALAVIFSILVTSITAIYTIGRKAGKIIDSQERLETGQVAMIESIGLLKDGQATIEEQNRNMEKRFDQHDQHDDAQFASIHQRITEEGRVKGERIARVETEVENLKARGHHGPAMGHT